MKRGRRPASSYSEEWRAASRARERKRKREWQRRNREGRRQAEDVLFQKVETETVEKNVTQVGQRCKMASALDLAETLLEGRDGLMSFLKVYGDESYDSTVYSCGSLLGWPRDFYYSGVEWEERLAAEGLSYFRASDCERLDGEFSVESPPNYGHERAKARAVSVRQDLVTIIQRCWPPLLGVTSSVVKKDFTDLVKENTRARACFGTNLMIFSYQMLIRDTISLLEQDSRSTTKIVFMFDEHSNWKVAEKAYSQLKEKDPLCAKRMVVAGHGDDKEFPGLQMADLIAHEARLQTKAWLQNPSQEERPVFKRLKESHNLYFIGVRGRAELLTLLEKEQNRPFAKE